MAFCLKVLLKHNLSGDTVKAVRSYLSQFLDQRHSLQHFGDSFSIYLHDPADVRLLHEQFPSLIANVEKVN